MEGDRKASERRASRITPYFLVRDGTGWNGPKRLSRPPRSTAPAPLRAPRIAGRVKGRNRGDGSLSGLAATKIVVDRGGEGRCRGSGQSGSGGSGQAWSG